MVLLVDQSTGLAMTPSNPSRHSKPGPFTGCESQPSEARVGDLRCVVGPPQRGSASGEDVCRERRGQCPEHAAGLRWRRGMMPVDRKVRNRSLTRACPSYLYECVVVLLDTTRHCSTCMAVWPRAGAACPEAGPAGCAQAGVPRGLACAAPSSSWMPALLQHQQRARGQCSQIDLATT